jgi:hypothetical protein
VGVLRQSTCVCRDTGPSRRLPPTEAHSRSILKIDVGTNRLLRKLSFQLIDNLYSPRPDIGRHHLSLVIVASNTSTHSRSYRLGTLPRPLILLLVQRTYHPTIHLRQPHHLHSPYPQLHFWHADGMDNFLSPCLFHGRPDHLGTEIRRRYPPIHALRGTLLYGLRCTHHDIWHLSPHSMDRFRHRCHRLRSSIGS